MRKHSLYIATLSLLFAGLLAAFLAHATPFGSPMGGTAATEATVRSSTYAGLFDPETGLAALGELVPGQRYSWSYQARFYMPGTGDTVVHTGEAETLIGVAESTTKMSLRVSSVEYPNDIILYTPDNAIAADGRRPLHGGVD